MLSVPRTRLAHFASFVMRTRKSPVFSPLTAQRRQISSKEIFSSSFDADFDIPASPIPPPPRPSLEEIVESGSSVLGELGLISWWKPSSYFRMALEGIHIHADLPWWVTIVCATVALRLALIAVPIMSQQLVAKQNKYRTELEDFRSRIQDAQKEGNNLLVQQVLIEQRDFLRAKDIRLGRQFFVLLANGSVFATQFFAIKKMIAVNYPGLSTGGTAWFTDLTVADPFYALPLISAATMALVSRVGIEMGTSSDQMSPAIRLGMLYGLPVIVFACSSQFGSGLCVYWCASNMISLIYAGVFRLEAVRKLLKIPPIVKPPRKSSSNAFQELINNYKSKRSVPPSIAQLKNKDADSFKKAGRGKPVAK